VSINNIAVFWDTLKQTEEKYTPLKSDVRYYNGLSPIEKSEEYTPVTMVHGGTVNTGYANADEMRVAILNFADALKFGGWVENGAQTQEENICRCTNIYPVLGCADSDKNYYKPNLDTLNPRKKGDFRHFGNKDEVYTDRIIYARDTIVFKDDTTYENVEPRKLDVITCPAPSAYLSMFEAMPIFVSRIEQIVLSAIENEAECIVLGAWGCGAFCQDPVLVADAFAEVLNKYGGYFKKIIFAIKPTPNWGERDLYDTFNVRLNRFYKGGTVSEKRLK
jgi:uncharacterized protein (TIGR02452 family)